MIARRRGKIINIGSMYGNIGVPHSPPIARARPRWRRSPKPRGERARHGIQVNCLAPETSTRIFPASLADEKLRALFLSRVPARRIGEPEEVAALAVDLASPASHFMTGQTVYLDGGRTIAW